MALNPKRSNLAVSTEADAVCGLLDNGYLRIYDGSQPATADTAIGAQVLLAELRFGTPAAGAAVDGVSTFNAITPDASADATGTAEWFRVLQSDGSTVMFDGSVGTSGTDITLSSTSIVMGAAVSLSTFTYTAHKS